MPDLIQRSFTAGELAPSMRGRVDTAMYQNGLALCRNFIVKPQGGIYSRPGMRFIEQVSLPDRKARLVPFSFNTTQNYILVFEHLKLRILKQGVYLLDGTGAVFELTTPYTETQLADLYHVQSADVMTLCHPSHPVKSLSRLADSPANWTLTDNSYTAVQGVTGLVIMATGIPPASPPPNKIYQYVVSWVDADGVESLPSLFNSISQIAQSITWGTMLTWSAKPGAVGYRVYKALSIDSQQYGWIGDTKTAAFNDFNLAPIMSDGPLSDRNPFLTAGNYPSTVSYYQQRQVFANTVNEPQTVFTTQTGNYRSFRVSNPVKDDDAVTFTIADRQVNEIRHLLSLGSLIMLTSGGEWQVTEGQDQVLTPSTLGVKKQSSYGASKAQPVVIGRSAIYVQDKGGRVRDLGYEFASDSFAGNDLSLVSEHLFEGHTIVQMAYAPEPYGVVWCLRSDGVLLALTYQREHNVRAWHHHVTDGFIESIAVISEDGRDALYMTVNRTVNGTSVKYIERLEKRDLSSAENSFCVDSGLSYNGAPATVISGLVHLEGRAVAVVADGSVVSGLTVSGGSITLPQVASVVHVGIPYTCEAETLDVDTAGQTTLKGKAVSVSKVVIEFEKSRGGFVAPKLDDGSIGQAREIKPRFQSDNYGTIPLRDYKSEVNIEPMWSKGGGLRIEQRDPLPMAILSIIPSTDVGG